MTGPLAPPRRRRWSAAVRRRSVAHARGTLAAAALAALAACASGGTGSSGRDTAPPPAPGQLPPNVPRQAGLGWPVKTREHIDLWLHGFALLQADTARVPLFRRGYRDELTVLENQANVVTQLGANAERLREGLRTIPALGNAQFVPFYFNSIEELRATVDRFIAGGGNPRAARSAAEQGALAVLGSYFPDAPSRQWLALFASSLWDEDAKFYRSYWTRQQRERANVIDSVTLLWQRTVLPRMGRVLRGLRQTDGDIFLSLPLDGEGRTASGGGVARNAIAVTFPERPSAAPEAIYVIAHEIAGVASGSVVADNTTPAEQRSGAAERLLAPAAVRGGLLLLEQTVPELADGYARYYVRSTGATPAGDVRAQLARLFPLPAPILAGITRQLEGLQSGI